jgi:hypothetical protein
VSSGRPVRKLTHDEAMARLIADDRAERRLLAEGRCPGCETLGVSLTMDGRGEGSVDPRLSGVWHTIRCAECGYMSDRLLEPGEYAPN